MVERPGPPRVARPALGLGQPIAVMAVMGWVPP
jgi:hypothetical protein